MISRRRAGVSITQSPPSCWLYIQPTTDCAKNPRTTLKFSEIFLLLSILLVSKENRSCVCYFWSAVNRVLQPLHPLPHFRPQPKQHLFRHLRRHRYRIPVVPLPPLPPHLPQQRIYPRRNPQQATGIGLSRHKRLPRKSLNQACNLLMNLPESHP